MRVTDLSFLLELSTGLAGITGRSVLSQALHDLAQPEFGFQSLNLFVRTPDGQQLLDWATEQPGATGPSGPRLAYPAAGFAGLFDRLAQADGPAVLPYDAAYFHLLGNAMLRADTRRIVRAGGYRECLGTLLRAGGEVVGYLCFNSQKKGTFQAAHLEVFQVVAEQVAAAVASLLAHEAAAARAREKTKLLEITELIAQVHATSDLLRLIVENIKPLFNFYDCGLFVVSANGQTHRDITVELPEICPSDWGTVLTTVSASLPHPGSPVEWTMAKLAAADQPLLFDFQDLVARFPDYPQFEGGEVLALGYRDGLAANLTVRGQTIGFFCINARQKGFFQPDQFALFQSIANTVAIAVANILANEEIVAREREKATLLEITKLIAQVKSSADLLRLIMEHIKPLFGFYDCGLFVVSADGQTHRDLTVELPEISPSEGNTFLATVPATLPHPGSPVEWNMAELSAAGQPMLFDFQDLTARFPDYPQFEVELIKALGYRDCLGANLTVRGQTIGFFCINARQKDFFQPAQFPLFQSIAHTVAIAVANILANEEIVEREQEKTLLLRLSEDMTTIHDRNELFRTLSERLRPVLGFDAAAVTIYSDDQTQYRHFLVNPSPRLEAHPLYSQVMAGSLLLADSPNGHILARFDEDDLYHWRTDDVSPQFPAHPTVRMLREAGLLHNVHTALRFQDRLIGSFHMHFGEAAAVPVAKFPLLRAIASQVAVAVANILAYEEIVAREREKTLHLAVTTALTSAEDWTTKLATVAREIGRVVAWDNCQFTFPDRGGLDASWRQRPDGALERLSADTARQELGLTPLDWLAGNRQTAPLQQQAAAYNETDVARLATEYDLVRLMHGHWGVRALLFLPVWQNNDLLAVLRLAASCPNAFPPAQLALLQRLAPQLALGLENLFSFDKIEQQERERTQQLALNNALVTIKNSFGLYHAVARELDPLVRLDSLSAWTFTADNLLHFTVLRKDEAGAFQDITKAARAAYAEIDTQEAEALLRRELPPAVYTGDAFAAMCAQHQVYRVRRDQFGVASTLELPLPVRNGLCSLLVLGSRVAFAFTPDDLRQVLPFAPQIALAVENMVAHEELNQLRKQAEQEKVYLAEEIKTAHNFEEMVGVSAALHGVFRQIGQVAGTEATVLITGETGTGKELIARTLHAQSARRARTLIKLNCAALPASLIESELFGHEKGAFTGAVDRRVGKFELAQGSSIFLDEIGELPLELQSKLLRVLQEREFERLGGNKVLRADVRVVAATNRNLAQEVAAGHFRADLYYRLSVFPIHMPALRERPEDIPLLAQHFARKFARAMGKPYRGIKEAALDELLLYNWPGNIRELENLVEQAVIVCPGPLEWSRSLRPLAAMALLPDMAQAGGRAVASSLKEEMDALERNRILAALNECKGRIRGKRGAALLLGLKPTTLESKMDKLGIRKEQLIVSS